MTVTVALHPDTEADACGWSAILSLGRFEGRMMLRHPVVWVGGVASVGLAIFELVEEAPVLNRVSMTLAWTMAPLAAAAALVAGWGVLRAKGRNDAHPPMVMPMGVSRRVAGVVLGLAWPALATLLVQAGLLVWVFTRDPVTSLVWSELLVGPGYVVFAGALSAALTRWIPHSWMPIFALLAMGVIQAAFPYNPGQWGSQIGLAALAPIAWPEDIIPYEVAFRPSLLHLGYLAGLAITVAGIASLGRGFIGWAVLVAGVVLAAGLGSAQLGPIEERRRLETIGRLVGDEANLTCQIHDGVGYCAMPGYDGWINDWHALARPVLAAAPTEAVNEVQVRQYPVHNTFLLDGEHYNDWWWIGPSYQDYMTRAVVPVASRFDPTWVGFRELTHHLGRRLVDCQPTGDCGESQQLVMLWLLLHDENVRTNVLGDAADGDYVSVDRCMATELWSRPDARDRIWADWDTLTDPATSYRKAGQVLGLAVPTDLNPDGFVEGGCS